MVGDPYVSQSQHQRGKFYADTKALLSFDSTRVSRKVRAAENGREQQRASYTENGSDR